MSTIYLTHTALVIEDCEDVWDDGSGGDVTPAQEDTIKKVGDHSVKLTVAAGAGVELLAYEDFSAADLTAKTHLVGWIYSTVALAAGDMQMLLDNHSACASPTETLNLPAVSASTWVRFCLAFSAPANLGAVVSVGIKQAVDKGALVLYLDDIRAVVGNDYDAYSVRGIDDLDDITLFPDLQNQFLDGSASRQNVGFWRNITLDLGVLTTKSDRTFLRAFSMATDQELIYNGESIPVVFTGDLAANWVENYSEAKQYFLTLRDKTLQTTNPASWS